MLVLDTQDAIRCTKVGRKKITPSIKRTLRFDLDVAKMLEIYAERNRLNITTAVNLLLRSQLRAHGLMEEAERRIAEETERQEDSSDNDNQP